MKNVYDLLAASKHMYMHEFLEVVSFLIYGLYEFKRFQDQPCSYSRKTITNMNPIKIRLLQKIILKIIPIALGVNPVQYCK
jgi:hypothetical protein